MSTERRDPIGTGVKGSLADVVAIIESAKARGGRAALEKHIAKTLPDISRDEVREAAEVATEVIDSIPVFLARARQEAEERGLESFVEPLLDRAEQYFMQPLDLMPEMTQGLVGLLDDSYLVVRILQHLDRGRESGRQTFLDWDLDDPARFLQRLIGPAVAQRLDRMASDAMQEVSEDLVEMWQRLSHEA